MTPCAQLIYCRDIADFGRFAGPLGRYLAVCGRPIVIVDANGPIPGLLGIFRRGSKPKYFRGRSGRGSAISPIPNTPYSACDRYDDAGGRRPKASN